MYTPLLNNASRILIHARGRMTPSETDYWRRLRFGLRDLGYELMIIAHNLSHEPMDVPLLKVRNGLDAVRHIPYGQGWSSWLINQGDLNEEHLLEWERQWRGVERDDEHRERRRLALYYYQNFYVAALKASRPSLSVIWHGHHPQEMILDDLCHKCGCPVAYIERGPFQGTIQLDREGVLGGSTIANQAHWRWPDACEAAHWRRVMVSLKNAYLESKATWYEQPHSEGGDKLRERLRIPHKAKVLLFAGQVDEDIQNLLYSPHFENNLSAFKWLCDILDGRDDIFILGKHHPKSNRPVEDYKTMASERGLWISDASIEDCLALADRVAAVNSTVLYEALMQNKPVLLMGKGLLSRKGIAYEVEDLAMGEMVIHDWIAAKKAYERQECWLDFGAYLLSTVLYTMKPPEKVTGQQDATQLADKLVKLAKRKESINYDQIPNDVEYTAFIEAPGLWDDTLRRINKLEDKYRHRSIGEKTHNLGLRILRVVRRMLRDLLGIL